MVDTLAALFGMTEPEEQDDGRTYRLNVHDLQKLCYETGEVDGIPVRMVPLEMYRHGTFTVKNDIETNSCGFEGAAHLYCAAANQSSDLTMAGAILDAVNRCSLLSSSDFDDYDIARYWSHP